MHDFMENIQNHYSNVYIQNVAKKFQLLNTIVWKLIKTNRFQVNSITVISWHQKRGNNNMVWLQGNNECLKNLIGCTKINILIIDIYLSVF